MNNPSFQTPFLSSAPAVNLQNAMFSQYWKGWANTFRLIEGCGMTMDYLNLTSYPNIVDNLYNSSGVVQTVCNYNIYNAYCSLPDIKIKADKGVPLKELNDTLSFAMYDPADIHHIFGRNTLHSSIMELIRLAERHGGSIGLISYLNENLEDLKTKIDIESNPKEYSISKKGELVVKAIPLTGLNQYTAGKNIMDDILQLTQKTILNSDESYKTLTQGIQTKLKKEKQITDYVLPTGNDKCVKIYLEGNKMVEVHISRLIPIASPYSNTRNWSSGTDSIGWGCSKLQAGLDSIFAYIMFHRTSLETLKMQNGIFIKMADVSNENLPNASSIANNAQQMAESLRNHSISVISKETDIERSAPDMTYIKEMHDVFITKICIDNQVQKEAFGENATGFSNGSDVQVKMSVVNKNTHAAYDWVWQKFYNYLYVNKYADIGGQSQDIMVYYNTNPQGTAKEEYDMKKGMLDSLILLQDKISTTELFKMINNLNIEGLQFDLKSDSID